MILGPDAGSSKHWSEEATFMALQSLGLHPGVGCLFRKPLELHLKMLVGPGGAREQTMQSIFGYFCFLA